MHVQTSKETIVPVPGQLPIQLPYVMFTHQIEVFLSILKSACHKLRIVHGLTLVTPRLCGWEAFPTLGAFTHTRIT